MVSLIPPRMRGMDRDIHRHPVALRKLAPKAHRELPPSIRRELHRQRDLHLPRGSRVTALLALLSHIPQDAPIQPLKLPAMDPLGQNDLRVQHIASVGVVVPPPIALIHQPHPGPIRRRPHRAPSRGTGNRLDRQVIARHGASAQRLQGAKPGGWRRRRGQAPQAGRRLSGRCRGPGRATRGRPAATGSRSGGAWTAPLPLGFAHSAGTAGLDCRLRQASRKCALSALRLFVCRS